MNGLDWDRRARSPRARRREVDIEGSLRGVIRDMLHRLGLSHFALIPSSADAPGAAGDLSADPGFDVRLVNDDLLVTRVNANVPDVRTGWRVVQIGDTAVADLIHVLPGRLRTPATGASTAGLGQEAEEHAGARAAVAGDSDRLVNVEAWRIAQTRLRGPAGSKVDVKFEDGTGTIVTRALERRPDEGQAVTVGNLPTMFVRVESSKKRTPAGATAGVIGFNVWMTAVDAEFQKAVDEFRHADGIVIDLRGNPGGLAAMLMGISGHFEAERKTLGVMKTRDSELRFFTNPRLVSATVRSGAVAGLAAGDLVRRDERLWQRVRVFLRGMQSDQVARISGQPSMGQALPALFDRLPNGDVLIHAYGDFVTSNGTRLEGRGVIPDEIQPLDRSELLAGHDRPLEAALAWIDRASVARAPQHP